MRTAALLSLTTALALAACSSSPPETLPEDNVVEVDNTVEDANAAVAPAENLTNVAEKAAPAPDFTDQQQMSDDADASGMTARLPDELPVGENATAPTK